MSVEVHLMWYTDPSIQKMASWVSPLLVVAGAVVLQDQDFTTDMVAVIFAICGGMATQLSLLVESKINWPLLLSELMFAAIGGFVVHAALMGTVEEVRLVWGTCAIVGAMGSKSLRAYGRKYLSQFPIFQVPDDQERK